MSIVWAGTEFGDFVRLGTGGLVGSGGAYDANYVRAGVYMQSGFEGNSNYMRADFPSPTEYIACRMNLPGGVNQANYTQMHLRSSIGSVCRIMTKGTNSVIYFQRWDGAAWVDVASFSAGNLAFMVRAKCTVAGVLELWINGALAASYAGDMSALGEVIEVRFGGLQSNTTQTSFSEVIAATHNVMNARLKSLAISADGTNAEWTSGSYADINSASHNDNVFIASEVAGQKDTFVVGNLYADTLEVDAVIVSGRFRRNTSGPTGVDALVRSAGIDHTGSVGTLTQRFEPKQAVWSIDPATSAPWTRAAVDALEIGVQSVA